MLNNNLCSLVLSPALLMRSGYCVELSTSSSSCSSMTLHWRKYGVSLAGLRMRVSLCRTPSTRSQSSSQRSSGQGGEARASSCTMSPPSAQTVTPARDGNGEQKVSYCRHVHPRFRPCPVRGGIFFLPVCRRLSIRVSATLSNQKYIILIMYNYEFYKTA